MKIAIYGDSYGNISLDNIPDDDIDRGPSWVELLAKDNEVTNFCNSGDSFFNQYTLYLDNNKNFDYNIFIVTQIHRLLVPKNYHGEVYKHVVPEKYKDEILDPAYRDNTFLQNERHDIIFHNLMLDSIPRINTKVLLIPSFPSSFKNSHGKSLFDVWQYERDNTVGWLDANSNYNFQPGIKLKDDNGIYYYHDYKKCHFTQENNIILYRKIKYSIKNRILYLDININDFKKPTENLEYYFIKRYIEFFNDYIPDRRATKEDIFN